MAKHMLETLKYLIVPINKEGYPFVLFFVVLTVILGLFSSTLGWICAILALFCLYFFRDPERVIPKGDNLIISPADGIVQKIEYNVPTPEGLMMLKDEKWTRVSIFLSVFNVHVNRVPASGKIIGMHYHEGKFVSAADDKESDDNEKQICAMETAKGGKILFVQIAGLIARRIVCHLEKSQEVSAGERYGLIRFGSRCDVYLPKGVNPEVLVGQIMVGGETVIAKLNSSHAVHTVAKKSDTIKEEKAVASVKVGKAKKKAVSKKKTS